MVASIKALVAIAAVLAVACAPSADARVGSGTRCSRQSKCLDFRVSKCNHGQRDVCIWWQKGKPGCDKFWSQPFPDVCTYKPAERNGYIYKPEVKGPGTVSWRYGWSRMVCQKIDATGYDPSAYFSVRGYVDCDGYEQKELRSTNGVYYLGEPPSASRHTRSCATSAATATPTTTTTSDTGAAGTAATARTTLTTRMAPPLSPRRVSGRCV
jgi:hypothetical protein